MENRTVEQQKGASSRDSAMGGPQIEVELAPAADGSAFDAWAGYLSWTSSVELVDPADRPAFGARAALYVLRHFIFSDASATHPHRVVRTPQDVARTGIDHVSICLHLTGSYAGTCGGAPFLAQPGDVSFVDFAQPFDYTITGFRSLGLIVPRTAFPASWSTRALHGLVPPRRRPATRLLVQNFRALAKLLPGMTEEEAFAAASALLALAEGVSSFGARSETAAPGARADLDLFDRARAVIERDLMSSRLSAASLADALHVSRSTLYRLFEDRGGVLAYVREARLHRAYEIIASGLHAGDTLGAVAASAGFSSEAHFGRLFRERYGMTPGEARTIARKRRVKIEPGAPGGLSPHLIQNLGR